MAGVALRDRLLELRDALAPGGLGSRPGDVGVERLGGALVAGEHEHEVVVFALVEVELEREHLAAVAVARGARLAASDPANVDSAGLGRSSRPTRAAQLAERLVAEARARG